MASNNALHNSTMHVITIDERKLGFTSKEILVAYVSGGEIGSFRGQESCKSNFVRHNQHSGLACYNHRKHQGALDALEGLSKLLVVHKKFYFYLFLNQVCKQAVRRRNGVATMETIVQLSLDGQLLRLYDFSIQSSYCTQEERAER